MAPIFARYPRLRTVTFTGVDARTDLDRLRQISAAYPPGAIEWGVLYSIAREGIEPRYPDLGWLDRWAFDESHGLTTALHLCGPIAQAWINEPDHDIQTLARAFGRLQLNVVGDRTNLAALRQAIAEGRHPYVLTQHHAGNAPLTAALAGLPNHGVLFDGSGGRGQVPVTWPDRLVGTACGYAGGLGPATIREAADAIARACPDQPYWLDMEQAVRTKDDAFDLDAVTAVLAALSVA